MMKPITGGTKGTEPGVARLVDISPFKASSGCRGISFE